MRMTEPRSAFCIGAPLSGKTAGVVIPNVLYNDNACLFIFDPSGEIAKATSGYRATLGPTFQMDFSLIDRPDKKLYYPCWNPLGKGNLPPAGSGRETYIDSLVQFLIPDGPSGSDPYWVRTGRGALCGLIFSSAWKNLPNNANSLRYRIRPFVCNSVATWSTLISEPT